MYIQIRQYRCEFYRNVVKCVLGAHFGRPFILVKRENETDHRNIRYIISIPAQTDIRCPEVIKKYNEILQTITEDISIKALIHLKIDMDDVFSEGKGIKSMTKKLQSIINSSNKSRKNHELANEILSNGNANSAIVLDIIDVIEKPGKFQQFFGLCNDLCRRRVEGALTKRHGSQEVVSHVTTISELHRLVSSMIQEIYTNTENGEIGHQKIYDCTPSKDYTQKQFCPRNQYAAKADRYYSELPFTLYSSSRTNHVKHVDFDYAQKLKMYFKEYAVENRENVIFIQVDDKNKVFHYIAITFYEYHLLCIVINLYVVNY